MVYGSLSRYVFAVVVIYVVVAAIAVVAIDLRFVLFPTACAALALVAAGLLVLRPFRCHVRIPWPAQIDPDGEAGVIVVGGESCPILGYEQELVVKMSTQRMTELLSCSTLAATALYLMVFHRGVGAASTRIGPFQAEFICISGCMVLVTCLRWFNERHFLRSARITLGSIIGPDPGFSRTGVRYQFFDQNQQRHGGECPLPRDANDNVVLVLYRANDPDINAIHGAFRFHQFHVGLLPGRRNVTAVAGARD